jgi:hypothetical protein
VIRKQLYIEASQDRALKRRARALGISEAELVRRALDQVLDDTRARPRRLDALEQFLQRAQALVARGHRSSRRTCREEIYEEREARLVRR